MIIRWRWRVHSIHTTSHITLCRRRTLLELCLVNLPSVLSIWRVCLIIRVWRCHCVDKWSIERVKFHTFFTCIGVASPQLLHDQFRGSDSNAGEMYDTSSVNMPDKRGMYFIVLFTLISRVIIVQSHKLGQIETCRQPIRKFCLTLLPNNLVI